MIESMLFTEFSFIFVFLPVTLLIYYSMPNTRIAIASVVLASLIFYGIWNIYFVPMLLFAIVSNYLVARKLELTGNKVWFYGGIFLALTPLFYFKYSGLFVHTIGLEIETGLLHEKLGSILPLGISFYTFQQILYLADVNSGKIKTAGLLEYAFFKLFFPQLIAGPIVHYRQLVPQIGQKVDQEKMFVEGCIYFALGFAKKFFIADTFAAFSDPIYDGTGVISTQLALIATLGYTFQLYFDFSGYSDMATGLARLFGFQLPWNFNSPYKAASMSDFWRRWHMTLSQFLRDYVYIPLGGNRKGELQRYRNLILTMLIGGLWHGAAWTFVAWGALHGLALAINHLWDRFAKIRLGFAAKVLTFIMVALFWVLFRATSFERALDIYGALLKFDPLAANSFWIWALLAAGICFFAPNSHAIVLRASSSRFRPADFNVGALARKLGAFSILSSGVLMAGAAAFYAYPVDRWTYERISAPSDAEGLTNRSGDLRSNLWRKDLFARSENRIAVVGSSFAVTKGRYALAASDKTPSYAVSESLALGGNGMLNGARVAAAIIETKSADVIVLAVSPLNFGNSLAIVPFSGECVDGLLTPEQRRSYGIPEKELSSCRSTSVKFLDLFQVFGSGRNHATQFRDFLRNVAVATISHRNSFRLIETGEGKIGPWLAATKDRLSTFANNTKGVADVSNGADAKFKWLERQIDVSLAENGVGAAILADLKKKADKAGIVLVVYETPTVKNSVAPNIYPGGFFEDYQADLQTVLAQNQIPYLDLSDLAPWNRAAMNDFIHASNEMREIVYQVILAWLYAPDALQKSGLLGERIVPSIPAMEGRRP